MTNSNINNAWSWDQNLPNFTLDLVSDSLVNKLGNYKVLSISVRLFTFYTFLDTRVLNLFKGLCIMRAAAVNSLDKDIRMYVCMTNSNINNAWSWDWNLPNFTLDLVSYHSANKCTQSAREL